MLTASCSPGGSGHLGTCGEAGMVQVPVAVQECRCRGTPPARRHVSGPRSAEQCTGAMVQPVRGW